MRGGGGAGRVQGGGGGQDGGFLNCSTMKTGTVKKKQGWQSSTEYGGKRLHTQNTSHYLSKTLLASLLCSVAGADVSTAICIHKPGLGQQSDTITWAEYKSAGEGSVKALNAREVYFHGLATEHTKTPHFFTRWHVGAVLSVGTSSPLCRERKAEAMKEHDSD